ncbi:hypothetical protein [Streptomyces virginiae]|uniref:hypothetical protein n=1 Tax=Streptomyces virginiae TaxID=1961 RepID=UPI0036C34B46
MRVEETIPLSGRTRLDTEKTRLLFTSPDGGRYLAQRHRWNVRAVRHSDPTEGLKLLDSRDLEGDSLSAGHLPFGGPGSFTLDMQGIDAFLFARAKYFSDMTARQSVVALGLVHPRARYLRVGAAGAPSSDTHPGGEVLEHSLLHGPRLAGESYTASGYLPEGGEHSRARGLHPTSESAGRLMNSPFLLERRSVYSHTAFLPEIGELPASARLLCLEGRRGGLKALDCIHDFTRAHGIDSYAVRLFVRVADPSDPPRVVGRVLRRIPRRRLRTVQEATDIASEREFTLAPGQELHCYGTYWPRRSPDWEALRKGKPYEPRGHIHMEVRGAPVGPLQHAISHLRELYVTEGTQCFALINPVDDVVRIEPVVQRGNVLLSRCSNRPVLNDVTAIQWEEHDSATQV